MVKGRSHLDDSLQKRLLVSGSVQPDFFPGFMRLKELPSIEAVETLLKLLLFIRDGNPRHAPHPGLNQPIQPGIIAETAAGEPQAIPCGFAAQYVCRTRYDDVSRGSEAGWRLNFISFC
jgi:hypothetical protein